VYTALELLRDKGHHLGDKTSVAWLRVYDILGDVELALALKEELTSAGHTLSDDFLSRLESITTRSHSQTSESALSHSHTSYPHSFIPGARERQL
jgi:hypothetical protein